MGYINELWHEQAWLVVACVVLVLSGILMLVSSNARAQLKNVLLLLVAITIVATAYHFVTGRSLTEIPQQIDAYFNTERPPEGTSHRYYSDPLEGAPESLRGDE